MSEWKAKRFWEQATVEAADGGFTVLLDGRPVRTPAKAPLLLPSRALAQHVADEWDAQEKEIDPRTMPFTRTANAAIDKVSVQHAEVADMLAAYGDSDLLCYRADAPEGLVHRQAELWNPALDWAEATLGVRLTPREGVLHKSQNREDLERLSAMVHKQTSFQLAAFHDLVSLSGSLILGFAAVADWRPAADIWNLSRLDEFWQQEQWGVDEEAEDMASHRQEAFMHAKRFFDAVGESPIH